MEYVFEWDFKKELENILKHRYSFEQAMEVFGDPNVICLEDARHSSEENRYYAVGKIKGGSILTVRYTVKGNVVRIFGAAYWRKWKKFYEKSSQPK